MDSKKKKGKYAGKIKLVDSHLLRPLLMIPIGILFIVTKNHILGKILLSAILLYFSYFRKKENPLLAKAILIITACMPWLTVMGVAQRQLLLAEMVLMYISLGALLYFNIRYRCSSWEVLSVAAFFMLSMLNASGRYTYVVDGTDMVYWPVYLVCAIAVTVVFVALAVKGILYIKDNRASESIALCILVAIFGFALPLLTVNNLNYVLDKSEPTVYEMVIEETVINRRVKGRTDYYLVFNNSGEKLKMEVSRSKYNQYEAGERLPVALYEGAFNKPYYIVE